MTTLRRHDKEWLEAELEEALDETPGRPDRVFSPGYARKTLPNELHISKKS